MKFIRIKDLASMTGIPAETIRYYERSNLLPEAKRTDNNYRIYDQGDVNRLRFIANCRALDMSLEEVRELIHFIEHAQDSENHVFDCSGVRVVIAEHLKHVQERLTGLLALEGQLKQLLQACDHPEPTTSCGMMQGLFSDIDVPKADAKHGVHTL